MGDTDESRSALLHRLAKDDRAWQAIAKNMDSDPTLVQWAIEQAAEGFENRDPSIHQRRAQTARTVKV